jgi:hypothetical protein
MTIQYSNLGMHRQLNQIVMAGSHDAGINQGMAHVKTQGLNIGEQAAAGVRVFDIRIAAQAASLVGGSKDIKLKAYHGSGKKSSTESYIKEAGVYGKVDQLRMVSGVAGSFGDGLSNMLDQANNFFRSNPGEFLILKFDKCSNWTAIANTCLMKLPRIYRGGGNINTKTLGELAGHVIVVFTSDGVAEVAKQGYGPAEGILGIRKVDEVPYTDNYDGIQYCGKGGTKVSNVIGDKIKENIAKQSGLMKEGAAGEPDVLGMMYWTTTGIFQSIKSRNSKMWTDNKQKKLRELWEGGLSESIGNRLSGNIDPTNYSSGGLLKTFMPNIVMIDFAKEKRCNMIYELNTVAATQLTDAARLVDQTLAQPKFGRLVRRGGR